MEKTPVPTRKAAKLRKAVELPKSASIYTEMFEGMAPPQAQAKPVSMGNMNLADISPNQLHALQKDNFALWAATAGIEVDHVPFNFAEHKYMLPMYMDMSQKIVLMKSAQMGATIWMLLRLLHFTLHNPAKACLFFPTQDGVGKLSRDRLAPLIKSNRDLDAAVQDTDTIGFKMIGQKSSLYLLHMGGEATKDSTPFDMLCFDEVRLLNPADIDQARERLSHSRYKYEMLVSTAGMPSSDIAAEFLRGTQNYFHLHCNCVDGFIPSECWPDCVELKGKEVKLVCPKCKKHITDNQQGRYIAHNPGADFPSYHISQFLSKFISVKEIWNAWQTTQNLKEFYNAKLGKPYIDAENQPVKDEDLEACVNTDIRWGKSIPTVSGAKIQRAMGVDQMSGINYVVIAERHANKKRIIHFEIIDNRNDIYTEAGRQVTPFKRLYKLMNEFDIDLCLIDAMPNTNEAMEFARAFVKRVFVTYYIEAQRDMVQWEDRPKDKIKVKKGGPGLKFKYVCLLSRYLSLDFALSEIGNRNFEWPNADALVQVCRSLETGRYEPLHIFRTHFYLHMKSLVRQKTLIDESTGRFKMEWVNMGIDPHACHAINLCNIAIERLRRTPIFSML
jgi:hypothetical protein